MSADVLTHEERPHRLTRFRVLGLLAAQSNDEHIEDRHEGDTKEGTSEHTTQHAHANGVLGTCAWTVSHSKRQHT